MKQILILTLIGASALCWAQQNVTGQIADQRDGKPLRGVTIATKNSVVLATSDAQGRFRFATSDPAPEIVITKKRLFGSPHHAVVTLSRTPSNFAE